MACAAAMNSIPKTPYALSRYLFVFQGGVHAHRNEVFLIRRGRDGLNARGRG
jgi:hypothetical protein